MAQSSPRQLLVKLTLVYNWILGIAGGQDLVCRLHIGQLTNHKVLTHPSTLPQNFSIVAEVIEMDDFEEVNLSEFN